MSCDDPLCLKCRVGDRYTPAEVITITKAMAIAAVDALGNCADAFVAASGDEAHPSKHGLVAIEAMTLVLSGLIRQAPESSRTDLIPVIIRELVSHAFPGGASVAGVVNVPNSASEAEVKAAISKAVEQATAELRPAGAQSGVQLKVPGTIH